VRVSCLILVSGRCPDVVERKNQPDPCEGEGVSSRKAGRQGRRPPPGGTEETARQCAVSLCPRVYIRNQSAAAKRSRGIQTGLSAEPGISGAFRADPQARGIDRSRRAPAVDESTLTEAQKKARSLFREALKEKGLGNFDKAFALFADCVELDIGYLGGNDEGIIVTALNHYESKLEAGKDPSAALFYNIYRFFRGDRDIAEKELGEFLAAKPAPELAAVAEK